ncbi:hypothetical protein ACJJIC_05395 [Microbulbifer sp. ANSA002]|uniref:hypothetical protein n=1 Tax=unclassified Microbulbifer TaxID=2619833 RepID=UPI0040437F89
MNKHLFIYISTLLFFTIYTTQSIANNNSFWQDLNRNIAVTPYGKKVAISCHNCYIKSSNAGESTQKTIGKIHEAQLLGADMIELDVIEHNGIVRVDHDNTTDEKGAPLDTVLLDPTLKSGDQILFIEIKENSQESDIAQNLLSVLDLRGYGSFKRPVFIRAFNDRRHHLKRVNELLNGKFSHLRPYIKLSELFGNQEANSIKGLQDKILAAKNSGFHGVEFEYRSKNIYSFISYAKSLNLLVSTYTIPKIFGEVYIAAMREDVDVMTVDYDLDKARKVISDNNGLLLAQWYNQRADGDTLLYKKNSIDGYNISVNASSTIPFDGIPYVEYLGLGEDRYGTSVVFRASEQDAITFYDADNNPGEGYFLATVVNFDHLDLPDGETSSLISKTDNGGFGLELHNPPGISTTVLRFAVRVNSKYYYASYPVTNLNDTDAYHIIGAYDGNGQVHLWINNIHVAQNGEWLKGGVVQNNSPILVGADPQGSKNKRFFSSTKIPFIYIQKWKDH